MWLGCVDFTLFLHCFEKIVKSELKRREKERMSHKKTEERERGLRPFAEARSRALLIN